MAYFSLPFEGMPPMRMGAPDSVVVWASMAANLAGWFSATSARGDIARDDLERNGDSGHAHGDLKSEARLVVPAAEEHENSVDGGDCETGGDVGSERAVEGLVEPGGVEHRIPRIDVGDVAVDDVESLGGVHPGVDGDDEDGGDGGANEERDADEQVCKGGEAVPAVDVHGEEDGLGEEREAFEGEGHADDAAGVVHERGPEEAQFEGEDGSGDGTDGEEEADDRRPCAGEAAVAEILLPVADALGQKEEQGHADADGGEDRVEREAKAHKGAGREEGVQRQASFAGLPTTV